MKLSKKAGATSELWQIFIADSSSTTGAGLTGLTSASSGLTAYYHRDTDTTATAITLVTMTVGTFTSSGFKEIDATNMPGWYQFCPPNAAIASGAKSCAVILKGATNMAPLPIEVQLTAVDVDDATAFGLSRLDAAVTSRMATYTQPTGFLAATFPGSVGTSTYAGGAVASVTGNVGGNVVGSVGSVTGLTASNLDVAVSTRMATYTQPTGFLAATFPGSVGTSTYAGGAVASVTGAVGSVGAGGITTASFAVGAIDNTVLSSNAEQAIADKVLATAVEGSLTLKQALQLIAAATAGKVSGGATTTITIRNASDTVNAIVATCDANGNRSAVTYTLT